MTAPSPASAKRRVFAVLGANVVGRLLNIAIQLLSTALFLRVWGIERYGEWLLVTAIPVYLVSADLGFSAAAANEMTMQASRGNTAEAEAVFRNCFGLVLLISVAITILAAVFFVYFPEQLMGVRHKISAHDARAVLALLTAAIAVSLPGELFSGAFRAVGRFGLGLMLNNAFVVVEFVLVIAALLSGMSPVGVAAASLAARLLRSVSIALFIRLALGWPGSLLPSFSMREIGRLTPPAMGFASFPLSRAIGNQGMVIVIGYVLGPASVVVFTSGRTMCRFVSTMAELFANSIYSEVSTAFGHGRRDFLIKLQYAGSQAALWVAGLIGLFLIVFRHQIAAVWLHGRVDFSLGLIVPLILAEAASAVYRVNLVMLTAANRHMRTALIYFSQSICTILIAYVLLQQFRLAGATSAIALTEIAMLALTAISASRLLETRPAELLAAMITPPVELVRVVANSAWQRLSS